LAEFRSVIATVPMNRTSVRKGREPDDRIIAAQAKNAVKAAASNTQIRRGKPRSTMGATRKEHVKGREATETASAIRSTDTPFFRNR